LQTPTASTRSRPDLESDPRLTLKAKRETIHYAEQSEQLSSFIRYFGITLRVIFSGGAIIGAMIAMLNIVDALRAVWWSGQKRTRLLAKQLLNQLLACAGGTCHDRPGSRSRGRFSGSMVPMWKPKCPAARSLR
jgi:hypothetical protein